MDTQHLQRRKHEEPASKSTAGATALILVVTVMASVLAVPEPLTTKEEQAVKDMIVLKFVADLKTNAVNIFVRFFDYYPEYQLLFHTFSQVSKEDLPCDPNLLGHATMILQKFGTVVVENLDKRGSMEQEFYEVAQNHVAKKVGAEHCKALIRTLKDHFQSTLQDTYSGALQSGWNKVFETLQAAFERGATEGLSTQ